MTASVEASLRALRTNHLDLLLIHRPDPLMDAAELAATFRQLQRDGMVLHVGVSNLSPSQFARLHPHVPLVTNQVELSPRQRSALSDGAPDQCLPLGIRPMTWSPLAGGRLFTGQDDDTRRVRSTRSHSSSASLPPRWRTPGSCATRRARSRSPARGASRRSARR